PGAHPLAPLADDIVSTGFPELDAILGTGGLPRQASATIRGDASSGKTTLALRCVAEAQARGAIAAYLDLTRSFDPLEAVSRGVDLDWLVVVRPADAGEGFRLAGALLSGRAVDLLVLDLPPRLAARQESIVRRLSAHARQTGARLLMLEPAGLSGSLQGALAEVSALRLELERCAWLRLGRDVVGQRTAVTVAKNRFGPPGRRVELEIRYVEEGDRAPGIACRLAGLGAIDPGPPEDRSARSRRPSIPVVHPMPPPIPFQPRSRPIDDAPPPSRLAPSAAPHRAGTPPAAGAGRARRPALGAGHGARLQPGRAAPRRPARAAPGERP
ncbi:MAG TPA: hypothetical protein VFK38_03010, partial [Candidatus Limnocylindrales bacterium]|nr:hypothetical protein [Candidatus Limnocylindrales bacterium]